MIVRVFNFLYGSSWAQFESEYSSMNRSFG